MEITSFISIVLCFIGTRAEESDSSVKEVCSTINYKESHFWENLKLGILEELRGSKNQSSTSKPNWFPQDGQHMTDSNRDLEGSCQEVAGHEGKWESESTNKIKRFVRRNKKHEQVLTEIKTRPDPEDAEEFSTNSENTKLSEFANGSSQPTTFRVKKKQAEVKGETKTKVHPESEIEKVSHPHWTIVLPEKCGTNTETSKVPPKKYKFNKGHRRTNSLLKKKRRKCLNKPCNSKKSNGCTKPTFVQKFSPENTKPTVPALIKIKNEQKFHFIQEIPGAKQGENSTAQYEAMEEKVELVFVTPHAINVESVTLSTGGSQERAFSYATDSLGKRVHCFTVTKFPNMTRSNKRALINIKAMMPSSIKRRHRHRKGKVKPKRTDRKDKRTPYSLLAAIRHKLDSLVAKAEALGPGNKGRTGRCEPLRSTEKKIWSNWSEWSACSVTCGEGVQSRRRDWQSKRNDTDRSQTEERPCHMPKCKKNMISILSHIL